MKNVAIVGGGFSGTLVAIHLLKNCCTPLSIYLIDRAGAFGTGVAYSTSDPHHFLNVRAKEMSAFPDEPLHFYRWLCDHESLWRGLDPVFAKLSYDPQSFLPRKIYGLYLKECLKSVQNNSLHLVTAAALDLEKQQEQLVLTLSDGQKLIADDLVIATGVESNTEAIFHPPADSILAQQDLSHNRDHVVIVGSGLTATDALMTLLTQGYKGHVTVLSKQGRFSEPHLPPTHSYSMVFEPLPNLRQLVHLFKKKLNEAKQQRIDWRPVFDALRPSTQALWAHLPIPEKKRFLRHLFSLWNRHRHRMPPACYEKISKAQSEGQVSLVKGRFISLETNGEVIYKIGGNVAKLQADAVLLCTGPNYAKNGLPLLQKACSLGLVAKDELNLSYRWSSKGPLYVLGALLFGERLETTAVPELRVQAQEVGKILLDKYSKNIYALDKRS